MKRTLILGLGLLLLFSMTLAAEFRSPFSYIEQAYGQGKINKWEAALLRAMVIFAPEQLPGEYAVSNATPFPSGTPHILHIEGDLADAPLSFRQRYEEIKGQRPDYSPDTEYMYDSPSGHFKFHYTKTGDHAVDLTDNNSNGVPDYVEEICTYTEAGWTKYHTDLSFMLPPGDGTTGGGTDIYDIYFKGAMGSTLGYCSPEPLSNDMPDYETRRPSHIVLRKNLLNQNKSATPVHEYQHACQFGYYSDYYDSTTAWMENTAVYYEEVVFPDDNDWAGYTWDRQTYPHWCNWHFAGGDLFCYGNGIWPIFLREYCLGWDDTFARDVHNMMGLYTTTTNGGWYTHCLKEVLEARQPESLEQVYLMFTAWNYLVKGKWMPSISYSEGDLFSRAANNSIAVTATQIQSGYNGSSGTDAPCTFGSNYIQLYTQGIGDGAVKIEFDGQESWYQGWGYVVLTHLNGSATDEDWEILYRKVIDNEDFTDTIIVPQRQLYDKIVFVPSNLRFVDGEASRTYTYTVNCYDEAHIVSLDPAYGPVCGGNSIEIFGANFDAGTTVTIGGTAAGSVTVQDSAHLDVTVPSGSVGYADVVITTSSHGTYTLTNGYTYYDQPAITGFSPDHGSMKGMTRVTVNGSNFAPGVTVSFGSQAASSVNVESAGQLTCVTPAGIPDKNTLVTITVEAPGFTPATSAGQYTYKSYSNVYYVPYAEDTSSYRINVGLAKMLSSKADMDASLNFYDEDNGLEATKPIGSLVPDYIYYPVVNAIQWVLSDTSGSPTEKIGAIEVETSETAGVIGGIVNNANSDPSVAGATDQTFTNGFTPIVLKAGPWLTRFAVYYPADSVAEEAEMVIKAYNSDGMLMNGPDGRYVGLYRGELFYQDDIVYNLGLDEGFFGSLVIESEQPVIGFCQQYTDSNTGGVYPVKSINDLATTLYVPYVEDTAEYRSNLGISNPYVDGVGTSQTASFNIFFYLPDGTLDASRSATICPNGYWGIVDIIRWVKNTSSCTNLSGYLKITSDYPINVIAGPVDNTSNDPSVLDAPTSTFITGFSPLVLRTSDWNTRLVLVNPHSTTDDVILNLRNPGTGVVQATVQYSIGAYEQLVIDDVITALGQPSGVYGLLEILQATDELDLVGMVHQYTNYNTGGIYPIYPITD